MPFLLPSPPSYDTTALRQKSFNERSRIICQESALFGHGAPHIVPLFYIAKIGLYCAVWMLFCWLTPSLGSPATISRWWLEPLAFQKAVLWSMLFEGMGLGCGSGPLSGRYYPPFGGFLYFLRTRTTKLPLWSKLPLFGGYQRGWLDVALYAALLVSLLRALLAPALGPEHLWPIVVLLPLAALGDRVTFLVFRGEHYWTLVTCFALAQATSFIAPAKSVWLALWFWAAVSKLNHHFPAVVCVMTSNSPVLRWQWLRRLMYKNHPDDLRPSRVAEGMSLAGTLLELAVPTLMLLAPADQVPVAGIVAMLLLHGFITSNLPLGVPLEWNVMMVYGGFALFWAHPEVSSFAHGNLAITGVLALMLVLLPALGNLFPERISFLLSMRYYAGNWPNSVWLMRWGAAKRFEKLVVSVPPIDKQLARIYPPDVAAGMFGRALVFRLMHLHGRCLSLLVPRAVANEREYLIVDGEGMAGRILGWNFGDGHLHSEALLDAVQAQCGFEPGELRCIFIESQPMFRQSLSYRIVDAASGVVERGAFPIRRLRAMQPWGEEPLTSEPPTPLSESPEHSHPTVHSHSSPLPTER